MTFFILPAALCLYYVVVWTAFGRNPKQGTIVPQYEPPGGMSPAAMRYLMTGTTDRKSVAAVLAHLAAKKLIAIQPQGGDYCITRNVQEAPSDLPPEEAAAFRALTEVEGFRIPGSSAPLHTVFLQARSNQYISLLGSVISGAVNSRVERLCFDRNLCYSLPATALSSLVSLVIAAAIEGQSGILFLTLWFLFCSVFLGIIVSMTVVPALRDMLRGRSAGRNMGQMLVPTIMFSGALAFVDWRIALGSNPEFAYTLFAVTLLNVSFTALLQRLTPLGRKLLDEVMGFREFLATVELDHLERMNNPKLTPALLNDYLAYAIALDLKEAWGDQLSEALSAAATSAG